jgi:hypothetical protein
MNGAVLGVAAARYLVGTAVAGPPLAYGTTLPGQGLEDATTGLGRVVITVVLVATI